MKTLSMFFTDSDFTFVEKNNGKSKLIEYGTVRLPEGYIKNGIIAEFDELATFIEGILSRTKITSKRVNLLLHEKAATVKVFPLPEDLKENRIGKYLYSMLDTELVLPFTDPILDFEVSHLNGVPEAIVFAASNKLVSDYIDLLAVVGLKVVTTDIPALSTHRLHQVTKEGFVPDDDETMFVNVYDNLISINIFNRRYPMFNTVLDKDVDISTGEYAEFIQDVQDEIYRMNNYYKWNLNKGKSNVTKVVITPMSSQDELNTEIERVMTENNMSGIESVHFYDNNDINNIYDVNVRYLITMSNTI